MHCNGNRETLRIRQYSEQSDFVVKRVYCMSTGNGSDSCHVLHSATNEMEGRQYEPGQANFTNLSSANLFVPVRVLAFAFHSWLNVARRPFRTGTSSFEFNRTLSFEDCSFFVCCLIKLCASVSTFSCFGCPLYRRNCSPIRQCHLSQELTCLFILFYFVLLWRAPLNGHKWFVQMRWKITCCSTVTTIDKYP